MFGEGGLVWVNTTVRLLRFARNDKFFSSFNSSSFDVTKDIF